MSGNVLHIAVRFNDGYVLLGISSTAKELLNKTEYKNEN